MTELDTTPLEVRGLPELANLDLQGSAGVVQAAAVFDLSNARALTLVLEWDLTGSGDAGRFDVLLVPVDQDGTELLGTGIGVSVLDMSANNVEGTRSLILMIGLHGTVNAQAFISSGTLAAITVQNHHAALGLHKVKVAINKVDVFNNATSSTLLSVDAFVVR